MGKRLGNRITLLTTSLDSGEAGQQVVLLATELAQRGYEVTVATMLAGGELASCLPAPVVLHELHTSGGVADPRAAIRLASHLRRFRPHVLHCHAFHACLLGRITRLIAPVPVLICTEQELQERSWKRDLSYRWTDWLADLTTHVSRFGLDRLVHNRLVPAMKSVWLPSGIDFRRPLADGAIAKRPSLWSGSGRLGGFVWLARDCSRDWEGAVNLLRAFASPLMHEDCVLAMVAGTALRPLLTSTIETLGLNSRVQLLDERADTPDLLSSADGYVLPTTAAHSPLRLLEAAASGTPLVATDVGSNSEVIKNGVTGTLVPAGDAAALAGAMTAVMRLESEERRRSVEQARQRLMSTYDIRVVVNRWENLFEHLLEGKYNPDQREINRLPVAW